MSTMGTAVPVNVLSTPAMIFNKLDFPLPFRPTTPILAPGKKQRLMFFKMVREPSGKILLRPVMVNINFLVKASNLSVHRKSDKMSRKPCPLSTVSALSFCLGWRVVGGFLEGLIFLCMETQVRIG